jgi:hypothetical protein
MRVDEEDLNRWRGQAREEGIGLSEWVRQRCNGESNGRLGGKADKDVRRVGGGMAETAEEKLSSCRHGVKSGWRCSLCRGKIGPGGEVLA